MKPHKWAKEIKAWADGAEIEHRWFREYASDWSEWSDFEGDWVSFDGIEYRIKPQPKEPQYLYVYATMSGFEITNEKTGIVGYVGKIKLETEND